MNEAMLLLGLAGNNGASHDGLWSLGLNEHNDASSLGGCEPFGGVGGGAEQHCDFEDLEPAELRQTFADFDDQFSAGATAVFAAAVELDLELLREEGSAQHAYTNIRRSATPQPRHTHSYLQMAPNARSFSASATDTRRHTHRTEVRTLAHSHSDTQLLHLPVLSQHPHVPTTFAQDERDTHESESGNEHESERENQDENFSASHHVWVFLMAVTASKDANSYGSGDNGSGGDRERGGSGSGGLGGQNIGGGDSGCGDDDAGAEIGVNDAGGSGVLGGGLGMSMLPLMFYDNIIAPVTAVMSTKLFGHSTSSTTPSDLAEHHVGDGLLDHYDVFLEDELAQPHSLHKSHSSPDLRSFRVRHETKPIELEIVGDEICDQVQNDKEVEEFFVIDELEEEETSNDEELKSSTPINAPPSSAGVATTSGFVPPLNSIPTSYRLPKATEFLGTPKDIEHMRLFKVGGADSKCGAFIAEDDRTCENAAIVKVWNNECAGRDVGEPCAHREGVYVGDAVKKEVAAYRLDQLHFDGALGVPHTELALVPASKFLEADRARLNNSPFALCSYQQYIANAQGSENFNANTTFPVDEVHKIAILDIIMANLDRNAPNVLVTRRKKLVPIDHGLTLPDYRHLKELSFDWLLWKQSKQPISLALRQRILAIDTAKGVDELQKLSVPPESIATYLLCVAFLKEGVKAGMSLYDIGNAMARDIAAEDDGPARFEMLVDEAKFSPLHIDLPADQVMFVDGFRARARVFFGDDEVRDEVLRARALSIKSAL